MSGDDFHQEIVDFINNSKDFKFPSPEEQKKLAELIDRWFIEVDDGTTDEFRKFDSYCEDEDLLKELFTYFSVKNPEFGLLCFRAAFGFVQDQSIVGRDIFNNISKLRYTDLLQRLDGYREFESRSEAKLFFERTLFPYSKNQEEKEKFLRFFEEEMIFEDDGEPKIKKNKTISFSL